MPSINFRPGFVPLILDGRKRQTIRQTLRRPYKVGDRLFMYTGLRTAYCKKIGEAVVDRVSQILINDVGVFLDGERLVGVPLIQFTAADGFSTPGEFLAFFNEQRDGADFVGRVLYWNALRE